MSDKPDGANEDPAEGSREIVERELKRQGDGKGRKESGGPGSMRRGAKPKPPNQTRH